MAIKQATILKTLYWGTALFAIPYFAAMVVTPIVESCGDWNYVLTTWYDWQSFNVGVLAFLSSVTALSISRINAESQRDRQFVAARAFLPHALSELCRYFKSSSAVLRCFWEEMDSQDGKYIGPSPKDFDELPGLYKEVFSRCIEFAEPEVGDQLSFILVRLQVFHSRMDSLKSSLGSTTNQLSPHELITYLFGLAQLQALINQLFPFARGQELFDGEPLTWEDYQNAYANLDLWLSDYEGLEDFTKQRIAKGSGT